MSRAPVHYLRRNEGVATPRAVAFLDVATSSQMRGDDEILTLRCWAARMVVRRPGKDNPAAGGVATGTTPEQLTAWLTACTRGRRSLWLYAHDLGRDLVTTRLPAALARSGWKITDFAMSAAAPWLRASQGRRGLTLLDSWSMLPASIEQLAAQLGVQPAREPGPDGSDQAWADWAAVNVTVLAASMCALMDWWDDVGLGRWSITGPTTGWAAMRHTLRDKAILIDPTPERQRHDRGAIYTGRRGVWHIGEHRRGPYLELDMVDAYPSVAAHLPLPRRRGFEFDGRRGDAERVVDGMWEPLAECVIDSPRARFPYRTSHGVIYPVGRFVTTLAGPDIAEARALGALAELRAGWLHELSYELSDWARWVTRVTAGDHQGAPAVARIAARAWGRSVIGKFGTRAWDRTRLGDWHPDSWAYEQGWHINTDAPGGMVWIDGAAWWTYQTDTGPDAYPGVNAWVESYVRVRLGRVIDAVGTSCVLQANTDGLIVDGATLGTHAAGGSLIAPDGLNRAQRHRWCLERLNLLTSPLRLRLKATYDAVTVLGPQTYAVSGQRRYSGIPKNATDLGAGRLSYRTWPGLTWQLQHGDPAGYVRPHVTASVQGPYPTGWLTSAGRVLAPPARIGESGSTELVPWAQTVYADAGHKLAAVQHPALKTLV